MTINALAIARELAARGAAVHLVATHAAGTLRSAIPDEIGITQLLPPGSEATARRNRLRRSIRAYRKFLRAFAPGVLLSAGNQGHLATVLAATGVRGLRLVFRISNDLDHSGHGRRVGFVARRLRLLKSRLIAARAARMVFVSGGLLRSWAKAGAADPAKATVIPNGVDAESVRQLAEQPCDHPWLQPDSAVPVVLGIGRLTGQKNFATLIRAVGIAARSRPLRLLLIGSGPLHDVLAKEAATAGLDGAFEIIPPVINPMPYIRCAAVVALPSWWEGASNVLLEALACETPVVASRTAGSAEEVLDGDRFGVLVDPADEQAIADALLRQTGTAPVPPGKRAGDFSRAAAMRAYADLLLGL